MEEIKTLPTPSICNYSYTQSFVNGVKFVKNFF
jgi:hypothetical protein